ncbi:pelota family protein [Aeropyrum camini]|uniref:Protein pelota homolog n=1 Tax=Aeropyrum camini SY1 = JCM 12091 TaxID=1198449 RepID=U3TGY9_9CREN|nr:pelota family protein [Aeropyrum camini]BAN90599.1 pelota-like protein [Aeropyrum camini SY1 = JCM 12091]
MRVEVLDNKRKIVRLRPESEEDLWLLRITLRPGDVVRIRTYRDVQVGSGRKERVAMTLSIRLDSIEFQPFTGKLRISGIVVEGPDEFGVKGRRHSTAVSIGTWLVVEREKGWGEKELDRLASGRARGTAVVAAVDYDEFALAVLAGHGMKILEDTSARLPGKDDPSREQEIEKYIDRAAGRIVEEASRHRAPIAVIAGPGLLKARVAEKVQRAMPSLKVATVDTSMGGVAGVREALRRETVTRILRELSIVEAEEVLEEFLRRIAKSRDTVAYTPQEVLAVARMGAVDTVLLVDSLLHSPDDAEREAVDEALRLVESMGGRVIIIPDDSPAGERLASFGGVVAILRYPVPQEARRL